MDNPNPYTSPRSASGTELTSLPAFGELVKGWEKLRLLYNAILILPGIAVMAHAVARDQISPPAAIAFALACGFGANLAFLLGPLAELYCRALFTRGKETPLLRRILFIGGTLLSLGFIALFFISSWITVSQNAV